MDIQVDNNPTVTVTMTSDEAKAVRYALAVAGVDFYDGRSRSSREAHRIWKLLSETMRKAGVE